jgi:heptaprenyl diphosphate synthase
MSAGRRVATIGVLVGAALALNVAEGLIPSPLPFVRIGLSNIVTLLALVTMGVREAVTVAVARVLLASVVSGTLGGPAFALAMGGAIAAALGMGAAARWAAPPLGVVGVSMVGAACHNAAQLAVVARLFGVGAAGLVPIALLVSAGAGLATGLAARFTLDRFDRHAGSWRSALA